MKNISRLGALIAYARRARGLSQEKLSELSGLPFDTIQRTETDTVFPNDLVDQSTVLLLADILKLDHEQVLNLPKTFDDGMFATISRRQPLTSLEEQRMLKASIDLAFADLEPEYPDL